MKGTDKSMRDKLRYFYKEWIYQLVSAACVVALIKWLTFDVYVIPTPSMEGSLLVGDFLLVSKLSYGARTPRTPLQIPLTNGTVWGTNIPSYLDWIQLPSYRLPGFGEVERGEIVVFQYPEELAKPADVRTFYVKRCVGLPGDSLYVSAGELYVEQQLLELPESVQYRYFLASTRTLHPRVFQALDIWEVQPVSNGYVFYASAVQAQKLTEKPFVEECTRLLTPQTQHEEHLFPQSSYFKWNIDHFGPILIPHQGLRIALTDTLLALYGPTILSHEERKDIDFREQRLYIDGEAQTHYTFKKDYYFMMGDNRYNSQDSRYWGFVPQDHVVGKPLLSVVSFDRHVPFWRAFRWSRLFKLVE